MPFVRAHVAILDEELPPFEVGEHPAPDRLILVGIEGAVRLSPVDRPSLPGSRTKKRSLGDRPVYSPVRTTRGRTPPGALRDAAAPARAAPNARGSTRRPRPCGFRGGRDRPPGSRSNVRSRRASSFSLFRRSTPGGSAYFTTPRGGAKCGGRPACPLRTRGSTSSRGANGRDGRRDGCWRRRASPGGSACRGGPWSAPPRRAPAAGRGSSVSRRRTRSGTDGPRPPEGACG